MIVLYHRIIYKLKVDSIFMAFPFQNFKTSPRKGYHLADYGCRSDTTERFDVPPFEDGARRTPKHKGYRSIGPATLERKYLERNLSLVTGMSDQSPVVMIPGSLVFNDDGRLCVEHCGKFLEIRHGDYLILPYTSRGTDNSYFYIDDSD